MGINRDKPDLWKKDIIQSVDFYNCWFMEFAPKTFRETRTATVAKVSSVFTETDYLKSISVDLLKKHPEILQILRMSTCPPIARERLVGLAGVTKSLVEKMENIKNPRVSPHLLPEKLAIERKRQIIRHSLSSFLSVILN